MLRVLAAGYGALFLVAAMSKLDGWTEWSQTTAALFRHRSLGTIVRFATPAVEAGVGTLALVAPQSGLLASVMLLAVFALAALVKARHHAGRACHCFGALMPSRIGYSLSARNVVLLAPAALMLALGGREPPAPYGLPELLAVVLLVVLLLVVSEFARLRAHVVEQLEVESGG